MYNPNMVTKAIFQAPPLQERTQIPRETILALVDHIVKRFSPEKIILFGSHAYGKPSAWSDVDFLVIKETSKGDLESQLEILKSLPTLNFGVDIIVRSQKTIEKRTKLGDWFLIDIIEKGEVLYERTG